MSSERKKFSLRNATPGTGTLPSGFEAALRKALNPQQVEAVLDFTGPQLILAGAGTGKTRTLVWRVAALVVASVGWARPAGGCVSGGPGRVCVPPGKNGR